MTDVLTPAQRRLNMSRIRGVNTRPEMLVRRLVHAFGYRYRLHAVDLPGRPDLVFRPRRKIIFVHGCFWHGHNCRYGRVRPRTNAAFWHAKLSGNRQRDRAVRSQLRRGGWQVLVVWECQLRDLERTRERLEEFLC